MPELPVLALGDADFHTHHASDAFTILRRDDPVHFVAPLQTWILSKHEDVRWASCEPAYFSVASGIRIDDAKYGVSTSEGFFGDGGEFLAFTDPPRHGELRRVLGPMFTPRAVKSRLDRIDNTAAHIAKSLIPGTPVDWVRFVEHLPILVALDVLGLPAEDAAMVRGWSDAMERLSDSLTPDELAEVYATFAPLAAYLNEHVDRRTKTDTEEIGENLISILLEQQREGSTPLSDANLIMLLQTVLGAGNDTMRSLLSGMVITFAEHPDQWKLLRQDPGLVESAVEEFRFVGLLLHEGSSGPSKSQSPYEINR